MIEELLDIVDENNKPTGEKALRSKIHAEGIWHRTIHVYIFHKNNNNIEFLVHLRSPFKDLRPNCWDTRFGGHIKTGLSVEEGVKAELEEEIGLNADGHKLIKGVWRKRDIMPNREFSKIYFLEYLDDIANLKFNDGEVREIKWLSIHEIKDFLTKNPDKWSGNIKGFTEVSNFLISLGLIPRGLPRWYQRKFFSIDTSWACPEEVH